MEELKNTFFEDVCNLLSNARKNVKKAADLAMVYSYFEVGRRIVEEEQSGADRAQYGQYILKELSEYLTKYPTDIVVIAVPKTCADEVAKTVISCGVKAIWNFANIDIPHPDDVIVENVHLTESLMTLVYKLNKDS